MGRVQTGTCARLTPSRSSPARFWPTASINKKSIAGSGIAPIGLSNTIPTSPWSRNTDGYICPAYLAPRGNSFSTSASSPVISVRPTWYLLRECASALRSKKRAVFSTLSTSVRVTGPISSLRLRSGRYGADRQCGRVATSIAFLTSRGTRNIYHRSYRLRGERRQNGTMF